MKKLIDWKGIVFWSNQFYAIAAVLLTIESSLQIAHSFPRWLILALVYLLTLWYYTQAYLLEASSIHCTERFNWYQKHKSYIKFRQVFLIGVLVYLLLNNFSVKDELKNVSNSKWLVVFITGIMALLYYLPSSKLLSFNKNNLYNQIQAWFKSISIAWIWMFATSIFPIIANTSVLYYCQNFIFILLLAILFDIKDQEADALLKRNTLVTVYGIQFVLRFLVPILTLLNFSLITLLFFVAKFPMYYVLIQSLTGILILSISGNMKGINKVHQHILYIDGLLFIKAILGILFVKL